jgi:hypothetical protein
MPRRQKKPKPETTQFQIKIPHISTSPLSAEVSTHHLTVFVPREIPIDTQLHTTAKVYVRDHYPHLLTPYQPDPFTSQPKAFSLSHPKTPSQIAPTS